MKKLEEGVCSGFGALPSYFRYTQLRNIGVFDLRNSFLVERRLEWVEQLGLFSWLSLELLICGGVSLRLIKGWWALTLGDIGQVELRRGLLGS